MLYGQQHERSFHGVGSRFFYSFLERAKVTTKTFCSRLIPDYYLPFHLRHLKNYKIFGMGMYIATAYLLA
jgi:hypothetical protein